MKIRPYGDRLVIRLDEPATRTPGGITIVCPKNTNTATIEAVGDVGTKSSTDFKAGDRVFMPQYFGTQIEDRLFVVKSEEVLGFVL